MRHFLRPATIIGALPDNIQNGQVEDAVPVMANYNWIVNQVNSNAAQLNLTPQLASANKFTNSQTILAGTVVVNNPALAITETFNSAPVVFNAFTINVTNTASGNLSKVFDFQTGGVDKFTGDIMGSYTIAGKFIGNGQLVFPAVQNPSPNVNTLDDYEEAQPWGPTPTNITNAPTVTITDSWYVKVGRQVTINVSGSMTVTAALAATAFSIPLPFPETGTGDMSGVAWYDGTVFNPGVVARASPAVAQIRWSAALATTNGAGLGFSATWTYLAAA